jgi:hypothetical protein
LNGVVSVDSSLSEDTKMAIDYYADARQIIDALVAEGLASQASGLLEVIAAGATSTEILMGVRWQLEQIDRAHKSTNPGTRSKIRELIAELNAALS